MELDYIKDNLKNYIINNNNIDENDILYFKQGVKDDIILQVNEILDDILQEFENDLEESEG